MAEVVIRSRFRTVTRSTERSSGFAADAAKNLIEKARAAPSSEELNASQGGMQCGNACGLSHRFAKYRQRIGGIRLS